MDVGIDVRDSCVLPYVVPVVEDTDGELVLDGAGAVGF